MLSRICRAVVCAFALAVCAHAQTGRNIIITSAARLGGTLGVGIQHPPSAGGHYYEAYFSAPTQAVTPIPFPNVSGVLLLIQNQMQMLYNGFLTNTGFTPTTFPVPSNVALLGVVFELQEVDFDPVTGNAWLSDNDVTVGIIPGLCKVDFACGTTASTTAGDMQLQTVDDNTVGQPVIGPLARFSYQVIRHRGQEGFVEGYAGTFSATSHNSDVCSVMAQRPARRLANAGYQVVSLPNDYDVAIVRDFANPKQFSMLSYYRPDGTARIIPNTTVTDTGTSANPASNLLPYVAFSDDGRFGAVVVHDTNTAVADRVLAFRTDGSVPAIDITATSPASATYQDASVFFTADFIVVAGDLGWYWTSSTSPSTLQPLTMPNTAASNRPPIHVFPFSWRVTRDAAAAYFPAGSDPAANRGEMDIYKLTNNAGTPQVVNFTNFASPTGIAEFGYSAITPSTSTASSNGIKCSVSPNGAKIAFLGATSVTTAFPGVYIADGVNPPQLITITNATFYSEVAFVNGATVVFFAGSPTAHDLFKFDLLTNQIGRLTRTADIKTRGQFWSLNKAYWYFVRSNDASTVNNIIGLHASTATLRDITGNEFVNGPAPAIRTGSFNTTADPWFALEMQMRFSNDGYAYFTARRETGTTGVFEDANVFRFDVERGLPAQMLTNYSATGSASAILNNESLTISHTGKLLAWGMRRGSGGEEVFYMPSAGGLVRQVSIPLTAGQSITDGSIFFTCDPTTGVVWSAGTGSTSVPNNLARVEWSPLGGPSIPLVLTPLPSGPTVYQVIGTHD
ncbi:MAG: hypothetical protein R3F56_01835 [Planctomycetota bacterium]